MNNYKVIKKNTKKGISEDVKLTLAGLFTFIFCAIMLKPLLQGNQLEHLFAVAAVFVITLKVCELYGRYLEKRR